MQQLVYVLFHLRHTDLFSAKHRGFSRGKVKPFKYFPHSVPIIPCKSFCFWQFHASVAKLRRAAVPVRNPASKKYQNTPFNVGYLAVQWTLIIIIAGFLSEESLSYRSHSSVSTEPNSIIIHILVINDLIKITYDMTENYAKLIQYLNNVEHSDWRPGIVRGTGP